MTNKQGVQIHFPIEAVETFETLVFQIREQLWIEYQRKYSLDVLRGFLIGQRNPPVAIGYARRVRNVYSVRRVFFQLIQSEERWKKWRETK